MPRPYRLLSLIFATLVSSASPQLLFGQSGSREFELAKQLDIFNALYRELDLYYVDTLDTEKRIGDAITYLTETIDPYTEYFPEEETDDLKQLSTGKYAGIGSVVGYREAVDRCVIIKPTEGMPATLAGLLPGDIIIGLDGKEIPPCGKKSLEERNKYSTDISSRLRGEPGTTVSVKVRRPGTNKIYLFAITRRNIATPSVTLSTVLPDSVGYIKLDRFITGTTSEVRHALVELKQQGARSLILDLRNNPGGLLEEAVGIVNLFIPRSREVVNTKGKIKEMNRVYKTTLDAQDTDIALVILVNEHSASAAEITAGALQDYDRALIMGRRTYGKGLVQQSRELPYKGILKLTTGKYYIPSGRCVQAYEFKDGRPIHLADSLSKEFRTAAGRSVKDGGGITPDITLPSDSLPNLISYLYASDQLFDYCVRYRRNHPNGIASPEDFELTAEEYDDFCRYMKENGFTYDRQSLRFLASLKEVARLEGYDTEAAAEIAALEKKLQHNEDYDFRRWEEEIRIVVGNAIMENFYYDAGAEAYRLRFDKEVKRAAETIRNKKLMYRTLSGEPEA